MLNGVKYIKQSIDRIGLSIPNSRYCAVVQHFGTKKETTYTGHSVIELFEVEGTRVQCERQNDVDEQYNKRAYITLLQPSIECQHRVKDAILKTVPVSMYKQFNASFSQIEVALDFIVDSEYSVDEVQDWINHHISLRYSRAGSRKQYIDTLYVGKKGNIREGSKGIRVYDPSGKRKLNEDMVRVELQLNRAYMTGKNMSISDMPVLPNVVDVFSHIQFIDDIDDKTVNSVVKKVISEIPSNRVMHVKSSIRRQLSSKLPARKQFDNLNNIKKKYNISVSKSTVSVFDSTHFEILMDIRSNEMDVYVYAENKREADKFVQTQNIKNNDINFICIDTCVEIANAPTNFNVLFVEGCTKRKYLYGELMYMLLKDAVFFDIGRHKRGGKIMDVTCSKDVQVCCMM